MRHVMWLCKVVPAVCVAAPEVSDAHPHQEPVVQRLQLRLRLPWHLVRRPDHGNQRNGDDVGAVVEEALVDDGEEGVEDRAVGLQVSLGTGRRGGMRRASLRSTWAATESSPRTSSSILALNISSTNAIWAVGR
ncbi:unnamed protein product [Pedinophyceae sp. YPF-701]|nr:unnamed protein product [Pedinophyceae sp. YPF-701]